MAIPVENRLTGGDILQISTISLHCQKVESLDYRLVKTTMIVGMFLL